MSSGMTYISTLSPTNALDVFVIANNIKNNVSTPLNKIYVSFGSKYNAPTVEFGDKTQQQTNSLYQMMPCFLQAKESYNDDQTLIIVIDDFHNKHNQIENYNLLQFYETDGTHIILCNSYCTETFVTSFMEYLMEFTSRLNISKENLMVCNFIKYLNMPNDFERMSANVIPIAIQRVLDLEQNRFYSECFYDWFGYRRALYNYVYCYKLYRHNYTATNKLEQILDEMDANPMTKIKIRDYNETNFWDKIYDITEYGIDKYRMSMSLRDRFISRNNLEFTPNK
jgi:hypothetical protein